MKVKDLCLTKGDTFKVAGIPFVVDTEHVAVCSEQLEKHTLSIYIGKAATTQRSLYGHMEVTDIVRLDKFVNIKCRVLRSDEIIEKGDFVVNDNEKFIIPVQDYWGSTPEKECISEGKYYSRVIRPIRNLE